MTRKPLIVAGVILAALIVIGGPLSVILTSDAQPEQIVAPADAASASSKVFLERYVLPDGRVTRLDQGNDTVSEGQAYAMLVAVAIGDQARFDSAWNWSKENLLQPNGLMAWQWKDGEVVDPQPATDADLDAARALSLAATRFNNPAYAQEARVLAKAIADHDVAYNNNGDPVLLAGPWAKDAPYHTNPSYHSPRAERELAALTTDTRWPAIEATQRQYVDDLIGTSIKEAKLPPDWAVVDQSGEIRVAGPPGRNDIGPQYSYDAVRLPIRLAESCEQVDRDQAALLWSILSRSQETRLAAQLGLEGQVINDQKVAVAAVASAAAAHAAGDDQQMLILLDVADKLERDNPTYYGGAWAALGRIMLSTDWLGACPNDQ